VKEKKWATQTIDMEEFSLKKLNDVGGKEEYLVKMIKEVCSFTKLKNDDVDINRAWETVKENFKKFSQKDLPCYYEFKQH
jgi:K+-sensing histidine kinase KdpD